MNTLLRTIFRFLVWIAGYHIISVWAIFGNGAVDSTTLALIRDALRAAIVIWVAIHVGHKKLRHFFEDRGYEVVMLIILSVWAIWFSRYQDIWRTEMLIGYKYDIYYLVIALSAVFVWYTALKHKQKYIDTLGEKFYRGVALFVIGGFVYQGIKALFPDFFLSIWYGPIGDYVLDAKPPLRYRTGPGWAARLQGLFAWPNNYWYFLVAIFSFLIVTSRQLRQQKITYRPRIVLLLVVYCVSLVWTLSRWAYVWVWVQLLLLTLVYYKKLLKHRFTFFRLALWGLMWLFGLVILLSYIKSGSTIWHIEAWQEWRQAFLASPRWYGLWVAGPSVHHTGIYLPESQFLQIMIDLWIVWFLFWIICWKVLLSPALDHLQHDKNIEQLPLYTLLALGIIGLMVEWFFLHTFEDSMVNYLILIPFGLLLGMSREWGELL